MFDYLYICIYLVFKRTYNKYTSDAPEMYSMGFLSVMLSVTFAIINNAFLGDTILYQMPYRGISIIIFFMLINIILFMRYIKRDRYKKLEKKIKGSFWLGLLVMILWAVGVYQYIFNYWKLA
jgi:peptidoglycan/LPS O-acetylase OafA/YrhL